MSDPEQEPGNGEHKRTVREGGPEDCRPNTPVVEKERRIQERLKEEKECSKGKRKKTLLQPTLGSSKSSRSGLVGPRVNREDNIYRRL